MTRKERHLRNLNRKGRTITATIVIGDVCPCTTQGGRDGEYDPLWHEAYPEAEDCQGSKLINRSKSNTSLKSFVIDYASLSNFYTKESISLIGRISTDVDSKVMVGACNTDGSEFDLTTLNEHSDYLTYNSIKYKLRDVIPLNPAQCGVLEKITKAL